MVFLLDDGFAAEPEWFRRALDLSPRVGTIDVEGVAIAYREWGPLQSPTARADVVLVHGGAAHSRWWDHLAPLLAEDRRIVALDLSGHGDSGRRAEYSLAGWAREVMAVARASGNPVPPIVVGHSVGGFVSLTAANRHGADLGGVMAIDTVIRGMSAEELAARDQIALAPLRLYVSHDDARRHYRLIPDQPGNLDCVLAHIAHHSVRAVDGGYSWKFDPRCVAREPLDVDSVYSPGCRTTLFYAENGMSDAAMREQIHRRLGDAVPAVLIPAAGHHAMIDQPLAVLTGIRAVLAEWER
jgi:pimeloyl-ACP methyl ester carboxylesterase